MTIKAYYNEIDPYCCAWLSNLMDAGLITPGVIDDRSIEDVRPRDLDGFDRCHFFAGIGVWDYALNMANWGSRPVWSGSCPCQPFSPAGKGAGFADKRHLWPAFFHLITQCHPTIVLGEQVAGKDADAWIDLVCADMEAMGYAFGAVPFPSAGVGAPHIRDRNYWVADANGGTGRQGRANVRGWPVGSNAQPRPGPGSGGMPGGLADSNGGHASAEGLQRGGEHGQQSQDGGVVRDTGPGPTNGFWRVADWLACTDAKWRPVEPGTFPLAHGAPARMGRTRAYGNAINAEAARVFIEAAMTTPSPTDKRNGQ